MPNRAALVTGASTGIGRAIATVLAEEGYDLTIVARHERRLATAAAELSAIHPNVLPINADVGREHDLVRIADAHRERWGRLDVLVNNAGIDLECPLERLPTAEFDHLVAVNLRAPHVLVRECHAMLTEAGAQHGTALVVNSSSIVGHTGGDEISAYASTKAGLLAFTGSINRELNDFGIRSTALCPALVDTPLTEHARGRVPADRMLPARDVAEAVRFLLRLSGRSVVPEVLFHRAGNGDLP